MLESHQGRCGAMPDLVDPEGHLRPAMNPEYTFQKGDPHFVTPKYLMSALWRETTGSAKEKIIGNWEI